MQGEVSSHFWVFRSLVNGVVSFPMEWLNSSSYSCAALLSSIWMKTSIAPISILVWKLFSNCPFWSLVMPLMFVVVILPIGPFSSSVIAAMLSLHMIAMSSKLIARFRSRCAYLTCASASQVSAPFPRLILFCSRFQCRFANHAVRNVHVMFLYSFVTWCYCAIIHI